MTEKKREFNDEFNSSRLTIQIQLKSGEKRLKNYRFESENLQNFTVLGGKIHLFRCEMTEESEELNSALNSTRFTIQIQLNPGEKKNRFESQKFDNFREKNAILCCF